MKARFNVSAAEIALGAERLVALAQAEPVGPSGAPPRVLLVAPPPVAKLTGFAEMFGGAEPKSREIAARYAEVAERCGVGFVDCRRSSSAAPISTASTTKPTSTPARPGDGGGGPNRAGVRPGRES